MTCCLFAVQSDATTEEKRQQHQRELGQKLNEEARERLKGMKSGSDDKKYGIFQTL
jgi:DNA-binding TFAR19-related protein (PDSD5 family)